MTSHTDLCVRRQQLLAELATIEEKLAEKENKQNFPKTIEVYLHGDRETMYERGKMLGLVGVPLEVFSRSLYEVTIELLVEFDGSSTIIKAY